MAVANGGHYGREERRALRATPSDGHRAAVVDEPHDLVVVALTFRQQARGACARGQAVAEGTVRRRHGRLEDGHGKPRGG
jgi:hypothetical protein